MGRTINLFFSIMVVKGGYRGEWWSRLPGSTLFYRGKKVATREEAAELARKWFALRVRQGMGFVDTTDGGRISAGVK